MLDSSIPLSVKSPQIASPAQSIGTLMQMRSQMSNIALHQAQIEQARQQTLDIKAQADQRNRDLGDQKTFQNTLAANGGHWNETFKQLESGGLIAPSNLLAFKEKHAASVRNESLQDAEDIKNNNARLLAVGSGIAGIRQLAPAARSEAYAGFKARTAADPQLGAAAAQLPDTWSDEWAEMAQWAGVASTQINDEAQKLKAGQRAATTAAQATTAASDLHEERLANLPKVVADATLAGLTAEGKAPTQPKDVVSATETNRHNKAEEALSGAQVSIARGREARENKIFEATYGEGSNEALRGVEPKSRQPALREANKAADEYNKAVTAAKDMQTFLDLARSGNKAAGSNLPLVGVSTINALNGIKRINQAEIAQYEGAGSLLDKIQGRIGGLTVGQPIPADVLKDIESLHKTLTGNASEAYGRKLESINQNFKSSFKPVGAAAKPQQPTMIRARDPQGKLHEAPEGTALPPGWKKEGS